jgi:hypothetical protein
MLMAMYKATILAISMLAFVRNRATNVLPVLLGLFFKISGTSSRVMLMLSNAGVCVSGRTIERLKLYISMLEYGSGRYASMCDARVSLFHCLFRTHHSGCILVAHGLYK